MYVAENGLFKGKHDKKNEINIALKTTRKSLDKHDISETETNYSNAWGLYSDALNSTKWHWRMLNLHAIHIWIYLIAILVSIFSIYYFGLLVCPDENKITENGQKNVSLSALPSTSKATATNNDSSTSEQHCYLTKTFGKDVVGFYAVTWGCVGAVLRGLWFLKDSVGRKLYRNAWVVYFLSVPFLGGLLGAVVYFIIIGGLLTVSTSVDVKQTIPVIVFAALAGFNWEWAVKIFVSLGETLSPKGSDSESKNKPDEPGRRPDSSV